MRAAPTLGKVHTSLAHQARDSVRVESNECLGEPRTGLNTTTGETFDLYCWRNRCPRCSRRIIARHVTGLILTMPTHFIRLSLVGDHWPAIRRRQADWRRRLRRAGYDLRFAWNVETNPLGTGHHVQGLAYARRFPPRSAMAELAVEAGLGLNVHVSRIRHLDRAAWYLFKEPRQSVGDLVGFLDTNGGTFLHYTRPFWRIGPGGPAVGGGAQQLLRETGLVGCGLFPRARPGSANENAVAPVTLSNSAWQLVKE